MQNAIDRKVSLFRQSVSLGCISTVLFVAAALYPSLGIPSSLIAGELSMRSLPAAERTRMELMVESEVQQVVDRQPRLEGQAPSVSVRVRLDVESEVIVIDLESSYLPTFYGGPLEDLLRELHAYASEALRGLVTVRGVTFLFDGREASYYYPEIGAPYPQSLRQNSTSTTGGPTQTIMISAMHGYYRHGKSNSWVLQRPDAPFGVYEDLITPVYADELVNQFTMRSGTASVFALPRSRSGAIHAPSGHQWRDVAALYNLEQLYPNDPAIWNVPAPNALNS